MKLTLILTLLASLVTTGLFSQPALAQNKGDEVVLEMQRAYGKNDAKRLSALLPQVRGHTLEPLAAYWEMRVRLDTASDSEIRQFLNTYAGSYYEDRLRNDWLQQLGKRRNWATFTAEYPSYRMRDDREVRCYAIARSLFTPTTLPKAIERLGFVQADPIRAPARAQSLELARLRHAVRQGGAAQRGARRARRGQAQRHAGEDRRALHRIQADRCHDRARVRRRAHLRGPLERAVAERASIARYHRPP